MQDKPAPSDKPQAASQEPQPVPDQDTFLAGRRFPGGTADRPVPRPLPAPRPRRNFFTGVVLPTALFLGAVAGIAFVVQNLPTWRSATTRPAGAEKGSVAALVKFPQPRAIWDPKDTEYALETEQGHDGYYDFLFLNESSTEAEVGLERVSCDCSKVQACTLPAAQAQAHVQKQQQEQNWRHGPPRNEPGYDWKDLRAGSEDTVVVPAGQGGLLRLTWKGRKGEGQTLRLSVMAWSQPRGTPRQRMPHALETRVIVAPAVSFYPNQLDLGIIVPNIPTQKSFWCWTATRDSLQLHVPKDRATPCIQYHLLDLTAADASETMLDLQNKLAREGIKTHIKAAFKIIVDVAEKRQDQQLDMGPLLQRPPLEVVADGEALTPQTPLMTGWVRSDVRLSDGRERDVVALGTFRKAAGIKKSVVLFADKDVQLKFVDREPAFLQVALHRKGERGSEALWELEVGVPPAAQEGSLPEGSAILLQAMRGNGQTRRVRVPITGTAIQY